MRGECREGRARSHACTPDGVCSPWRPPTAPPIDAASLLTASRASASAASVACTVIDAMSFVICSALASAAASCANGPEAAAAGAGAAAIGSAAESAAGAGAAARLAAAAARFSSFSLSIAERSIGISVASLIVILATTAVCEFTFFPRVRSNNTKRRESAARNEACCAVHKARRPQVYVAMGFDCI